MGRVSMQTGLETSANPPYSEGATCPPIAPIQEAPLKMPRRIFAPHFRVFTLDPESPEPLHRQLYDEIRRAILAGLLAPGSRLPASREMATATKLSRNTVLAAYEQLMAEGYIEGRPGSGTYVARAIPEASRPEQLHAPVKPAVENANRAISRAARRCRLNSMLHVPGALPADAFRPGLPALDQFPMHIWRRLSDRRLRNATTRMLTYDDPQGFPPLREAIAGHLSTTRGARCTADQVIIMSGSQQAVDIAARVLLDPGDEVWFEDPGYFAAYAALDMHGARVVPVPVDEEGLVVSAGVAKAPSARLAYVTPSQQNPTGVTMSLTRRMSLLQWAERASAWVLEDDNASEYRYEGRPLAALQGIDANERTLYIGTFSKVLFASLRLGYLVAPLDLVPALVKARELVDRQSSTWQQAVVADFMAEGHFGRHLRRMRVLYAHRLEALDRAISRHAADLFQLPPREGGMNRVVYFLSDIDDVAAAAAAQAAGVSCLPLSHYRLTPGGRPGLVLGFTSIDEETTSYAIQKLATTIRPLRPLPPLVPGTLEAME